MNAPVVVPERSGDGAWVPLKMQRDALACGAYELFLGGAAGPGKSEYLVVAPLRWVNHPTFRAVLFRNTFPELQRTLIEKSRRLYPSVGGVYNEARHAWTFRSGAQIEFAYLESDRDVHRYQGAEFQFVGWDELPHFTEYAYRYMQSRLRSAAGVPIRLRATGNPDGPHLEWVRARFAEWIEGRAPMGAARWFSPDGVIVDRTAEHALSRCYIPGRLRDNPYLPPEYVAQLMALDPVTRAKLLDGDWDACVGEGKLFHRDWWTYLDAAPPVARKVRAWDLGAGGDPTEGVLIGDRGPGIVPRYVVLDVITHVGPPHEVHALIASTAKADGKAVTVRLPQDPGQAGKDQALTYARELAGYTVRSKPATGDKVVRAGPFSSQVGARNAAVVRAPWTPGFVGQLHAFPDTKRDDKCFAAGTMVETVEGPRAIETIREGDKVWTREGLRLVTRAWMTSPAAAVVEVELSSGVRLVATPNHPVFVEESGFVRVDSLTDGTMLKGWRNPSFSTASPSGDTPARPTSVIAGTSPRDLTTQGAALRHSTEKSGSRCMARSPRGTTSTTATATRSTTTSATLSACRSSSIGANTATPTALPSNLNTSPECSPSPPSGTHRPRASHGTARLAASLGRRGPSTHSPAPSAAGCSQAATQPPRSAATPAAPEAVAVVAVRQLPDPTPVYNLSVAGLPEYFAGGVLVHNCDAAADAFSELASTFASGPVSTVTSQNTTANAWG